MPAVDTGKQSKTYVSGYQVYEVSPLSHYFEEVYGHIKGIPAIGPRGDQNYFWYSKDKNGTAYYEVHEQELSAKSTFDFLSTENHTEHYFKGINAVLAQAREWTEKYGSLNIENLSTAELFQNTMSLWQLDADIFSYYLVSQPYRLQIYEDMVRWELQKRVAKVKIDEYLALITSSDKMTENVHEELDWANMILEAKRLLGPDSSSEELTQDKRILPALRRHFDRYKVLSLGDGSWDLNFDTEISRFKHDIKKPEKGYIQRIKDIKSSREQAMEKRAATLKALEFDKPTLEAIDFLSEMSHVRYTMRVSGFIPVIFMMIQMSNQLAERIGYENNGYLSFLTYTEFEQAMRAGKAVISLEELKKRRGNHDEFLLRINEGKVEYYYGEEAGKLFRELVPPVDYSKTSLLKGVSAQNGLVTASATVYKWGDDMQAAIDKIRKHPILVTGQTRPSMMALIRLAKGIVTDEGGVTSHAAIVARELGIPTIINTGSATKVFKTGDKVELDANNGTVRKVEV
jgi:phosphoenolpyruvate synthase/pyruvate phosphate dikinase